MGALTFCCPLLFTTLRFLGRPTGRGSSGQRVAASRARRPRYPGADLGPHRAGREAQIGRVGDDVRDEAVPPGVEPGVRARDRVVGHNSLLLCELTAAAAAGRHYGRAEWPVSTGIGPRRRVAPRLINAHRMAIPMPLASTETAESGCAASSEIHRARPGV